MLAYLIFTRIRTKDKAELDKYFASGEQADDLPFTVLVGYGEQEVLEGDGHEGMVVLEFENSQAVRDWYESPFYQRISRHRRRGADYQVTLVEGMPTIGR